MKKLKINPELEITVCEGISDISYSRAVKFKQYISQLMFDITLPLFQQAFANYKKAADRGQHSNGLLIWQNFESAIKLKEPNVDALGICFSLIIKENEKDVSTDDNYHKDRIERLSKAGLSYEMVEEEVEAFMQAFPAIYSYFSEWKGNLAKEIASIKKLSI